MHTQLFEDLKDDYNRQLRAHRFKRFMARCWFAAAGGVLAMAVGGMIEQAHSLLFVLAVLLVLAGGFVGYRYLSTHH